MFELVPVELYYPIYVNLSLGIVLFTLLHAYVLPIDDQKNVAFINWTGYLFLIFSLLFIGTRPVSGRFFGDMVTYNRYFTFYAAGGEVDLEKDVFFHLYMKLCSHILSVKMFFALCFFFYLFPLYRVSKVFFKQYWFYSFLMFAVSFSFWTYGTNGIRNGIACSIFLWGLSYYHNKIIMGIIFFISIQIHQTLLLPVMAFSIAFFYTKPKIFLMGWLAAIPLSIALGGFWENLFASMGFGDDRLGGYLTGGDEFKESFSSTGFRYDFLFYSAGAVFAGWYFIFKKDFQDKIYHVIYGTYLICNAFWILVIRASFSNRFAYLSWFMMGIVIIYPYLKRKFFKNHHIVVGKILTVYFMFTYLMYYVYYS